MVDVRGLPDGPSDGDQRGRAPKNGVEINLTAVEDGADRPRSRGKTPIDVVNTV
jgi:hypothetical protein